MPSVKEGIYQTPAQPKQLRLDTTTACNAGCLSCHRFISKRKGKMDIELIGEILIDVSRWKEPLGEIVPVNYGEFFTREDWYLILTMITQKLPCTPIVIPTNGALFGAELVKQLCNVPTLKILNFSINAYYDETYEQFMKLPASTIQTIRQAVAQIRILRPDIFLVTSMVFDPEYQTDLERDLFIDYWISFSKPQIIAAASCGRPTKKPDYPVKLPCRSIFSDIVIGFDRRLSSCCFDSNFCLDLSEYSGDLKKDWRNDKLETLRKIHNDRKRDTIPLCKACTFS